MVLYSTYSSAVSFFWVTTVSDIHPFCSMQLSVAFVPLNDYNTIFSHGDG